MFASESTKSAFPEVFSISLDTTLLCVIKGTGHFPTKGENILSMTLNNLKRVTVKQLHMFWMVLGKFW